MGTPDIQTPEMMIDIKTVTVQSNIIHTPWIIVHEEPFVIYHSHETWVEMQRAEKTINFIIRLKRKYNEKNDIMRYRNVLNVFGLM
jgi:hypothetical protein